MVASRLVWMFTDRLRCRKMLDVTTMRKILEMTRVMWKKKVS